jgi:hypothetical protein
MTNIVAAHSAAFHQRDIIHRVAEPKGRHLLQVGIPDAD